MYTHTYMHTYTSTLNVNLKISKGSLNSCKCVCVCVCQRSRMLFRSSRRLNAMILVFPFCSCSYESDASSCLSIFVRICRSWRTAICIVTDESLLARVHASGSCATLRRKWNSRRLRECFSRPYPTPPPHSPVCGFLLRSFTGSGISTSTRDIIFPLFSSFFNLDVLYFLYSSNLFNYILKR